MPVRAKNIARLTQIAQGSSTVSFAYDNGSQLTAINYTLGQNNLGNLTYAYDLAGRRTSMGGSLAAVNLPNAISTTAYNVDNQLTQWGTATPTYDANGNTLSDGTNTYVWNARNQLASMNLTGESFAYDPFGRRTSKTILGTTTSFLYDRANPVQELSGTTPIANMLTGGIDEYFTRADSTGTANFLTDAVGSTTALTNSSGTTTASYTYEPFGNTSATGSSTNTYQYTGRENDGTGVYFYRARYYSPASQRFISEDPLQFRANSVNFYELGYDDPTSVTDPTGRLPIVVGSGAGAAVSVTTTVTVTSIGGGSTPVFSLVAGGSGEGAWAGPIGVLAGLDAALLANDINGGIQLYHAYYPSPNPNAGPSQNPSANPLAGRGSCKGNIDCKQVKDDCIETCSETSLPSGDNGFRFWNCVNKCMEAAGCR